MFDGIMATRAAECRKAKVRDCEGCQQQRCCHQPTDRYHTKHTAVRDASVNPKTMANVQDPSVDPTMIANTNRAISHRTESNALTHTQLLGHEEQNLDDDDDGDQVSRQDPKRPEIRLIDFDEMHCFQTILINPQTSAHLKLKF